MLVINAGSCVACIFETKPAAPALAIGSWYASDAEHAITKGRGRSEADAEVILRVASIPLIRPLRLTSIMMTSGVSSDAKRTASSPSAVSAITVIVSRSRNSARTPKRNNTLSSTRMILIRDGMGD